MKKILYILWFLPLFCLPLLYYHKIGYIVSLLMLTLTYITIASSWNLLGGFAGQISLGHGTFFGAASYTMFILLAMGHNMAVSITVGIAVGILSIILTFPLLRLRGAYFAIGTLFFAELFKHAFTYRQVLTGEELTLYVPLKMRLPDEGYLILMFMLAYLSVLTVYKISNSKLSYAFKAIRNDEDVAEELGINTMKYKVIALFISALFTSFAGIVYMHYFGRVSPSNAFHITWSVSPVFITILGGMQTVLGPIIGAFIFVVLSQVLIGPLGEMSLMVWALIVILIIYFVPQGLYRVIKECYQKIFFLPPLQLRYKLRQRIGS